MVLTRKEINEVKKIVRKDFANRRLIVEKKMINALKRKKK